jgi:hypothetical protein
MASTEHATKLVAALAAPFDRLPRVSVVQRGVEPSGYGA